MESKDILKKIKGGLIVSCQALEGEPLFSPYIMGKMALAAQIGGAVAIRANSVDDIKEIKKNVDLPIIGLIKQDYPNHKRYITPTLKEIKALIEVGVDVIALDVTYRDNQNSVNFKEKLDFIHKHKILAMADISTLKEGQEAEKLGFDIISTTLSGYTDYSRQLEGPDHKLVKELVKHVRIPVIAEGKINSQDHLKKILKSKPFAVVMGGAITRPQLITKKYADIVEAFKK